MRFFILVFTICILQACVSKKEYNSLLDKYMQSQIEKSNCEKSLGNHKGQTTIDSFKIAQLIEKLRNDSASLSLQINNLKNDLEVAQFEKEKMETEFQQKLINALSEKQKSNAELLQLQLDLEKQKQTLDQKEKSLQQLQNDIQQKINKINELEKNLNEQKQQTENLKDTIMNALTQFEAGELEVYVKEGKVYVSMSDKLLFKSGSTVVEPKGIDVLGKLAEVIKKNTNIMVNIEGHTDNVPYKSSNGCMKDNWDLSLMRASSVLHILTEKYFVSRLQLTASGKGEFSPKASNTTPEGRAQNRRTEIILSPKVDKIMQLLSK